MFCLLPKTPDEPKIVKVPLGDGLYATIDNDDSDLIKNYTWKSGLFKCSYYANCRTRINGRWRTLRMHRLIAGTPPRKVCHHLNHNSLDNRRKNLVNMTPQEHMAEHTNNTIRVKFKRNQSETQLSPPPLC